MSIIYTETLLLLSSDKAREGEELTLMINREAEAQFEVFTHKHHPGHGPVPALRTLAPDLG